MIGPVSGYEQPLEGLRRLAQDSPNGIALFDQGRTIAYDELLPWVEGVAAGARQCVKAHDGEVFLPVPVRRSIESVVAVLACLSYGIPFFPVDWRAPRQYVTTLIARAGGPRWFVASSPEHPPCMPAGVQGAPRLGRLTRSSDVNAAGCDAVLVVFTSGTTSSPKGVVLDRETVIRRWRYRKSLVSESAQSHKAPFLFSPDSVTGVNQCLDVAFGCAQLLIDPSGLRPFDLVCQLEAFQPTHLAFPSQLARVISHACESMVRPLRSVDVVGFGGESIRYEFVEGLRRLLREDTMLFHTLSSTEGGRTLHHEVRNADAPGEGVMPVGYPAFPGELRFLAVPGFPEDVRQVLVGGAIASRYLGDPDLTAARFSVDGQGRRWWSSGDLVSQSENGAYLYRGRIDDIVKVQGKAASPADITAALLQVVGVRNAIVVADQSGHVTRLVAHVEVDDEANLDPARIRAALRRDLPPHLIPGAIFRHARLPLGPRGKVDRTRLQQGQFLSW